LHRREQEARDGIEDDGDGDDVEGRVEVAPLELVGQTLVGHLPQTAGDAGGGEPADGAVDERREDRHGGGVARDAGLDGPERTHPFGPADDQQRRGDDVGDDGHPAGIEEVADAFGRLVDRRFETEPPEQRVEPE